MNCLRDDRTVDFDAVLRSVFAYIFGNIDREILLGLGKIVELSDDLSDRSFGGGLGIILGSVMYSLPISFLMFYDILKYEDALPYDVAETLGINKFHQFKDLTLPYLRKPLISIAFAVFTMIITDYGVPLMVGGHVKTMPVMMYEDVIGLLDFAKGSVIGAVLLIPAFIAFVVDYLNRSEATASFIKTPFCIRKNKKRDFFSYLFLSVISVFVLLPLLTFAFLSFVAKYPMDLSFTLDHVQRTFEMGGLHIFIRVIEPIV